jgi:hypothetical protein
MVDQGQQGSACGELAWTRLFNFVVACDICTTGVLLEAERFSDPYDDARDDRFLLSVIGAGRARLVGVVVPTSPRTRVPVPAQPLEAGLDRPSSSSARSAIWTTRRACHTHTA